MSSRTGAGVVSSPAATTSRVPAVHWIPMGVVGIYCLFMVPASVLMMLDDPLRPAADTTEPVIVQTCVAVTHFFTQGLPSSLAGLLSLVASYKCLLARNRSAKLMRWVLPLLILTVLIDVMADMVLWLRGGYAVFGGMTTTFPVGGRVIPVVNAGYWIEQVAMAIPLWIALAAYSMQQFSLRRGQPFDPKAVGGPDNDSQPPPL